MQLQLYTPEDEDVLGAFRDTKKVTLYVRRFHIFEYRTLTFGGMSVYLRHLAEVLNLEPQMFLPIFSYYGEGKAPPETVSSYEELGAMPEYDSFRELAKLLGKTMVVRREYGSVGTTDPLFTVFLDGTIRRDDEEDSEKKA